MPTLHRRARAILTLGAFASAAAAAAPLPTAESQTVTIQVPAGFEVVPAALTPLVGYPMLGGFDERGRLFVAENAGLTPSRPALEAQTPSRIRMLEDTDGDGVFDRSSVFADRLTFPQGVQWHDGALYVASPPSLWQLEDTDGDGRADVRTELVTGFNFDGNAADIHGPFLHPNGRLYWCHGRKGHEVFQRDGTLVSKALGARIWSCRPDGSDIQVHAGGGMDNPVELAFNQEGDIFGTVNLFHGAPRADALVHWIHGGVYPRTDAGNVLAEFKRSGDVLPPVTLLGHVAPSGLALLSNESWGPEFHGNLFLAEFNTRRIMRIAPERAGSTFRGSPEVFASAAGPGVHFSDVIEDADGSLLIIDTGEWYRRCPTSGSTQAEIPGGIYRIRKINAPRVADPRGLAITWSGLSPEATIALLADPRPAVRTRATSELVRKGAGATAALTVALDDRHDLVRSNAVWALTRIGSPTAQAAVRGALADRAPGVRQAACQSVFVTRDTDALAPLTLMLRDEAPAVLRETARVLGRLRLPSAIPALGATVARTQTDAILTHALVYALIEIADVNGTRMLLEDARPSVRRAGLIALDQIAPGSVSAEPVFDALRSPDGDLRATAAGIATKHPQWSREAAAYVAFAFADAPHAGFSESGEEILSSFLRTPEVRAWFREQLDPRSAFSLRHSRSGITAIARTPDIWDEAWRGPVRAALQSQDLSLAQLAMRAVATHRKQDFGIELREVAGDAARPAAFRVAALQLATDGREGLDRDAFRMLIEPFATGGSPQARMQAAAVLANARLQRGQFLELAGHLPGAGPMELTPLLHAFKHAPADAQIAAELLGNLRRSPARWAVAGHTLQALFRRFPRPAAEAAEPLIAEIMHQARAKDTRLAELEKTVLAGDPARGRAAFLSGIGACLACHRVGDNGGTLGPDLSHIGRIRTTRDLLEAVAFPDATIARGYEAFQIATRDGNSLLGTIPRETTDSVSVLTADGQETNVPRAAISKMEPVPNSLMPPGLDRTLEPSTLADLVAFLRSLQ